MSGKIRIMLIEDSPQHQDFIRALLNDHVPDGRDAFELVGIAATVDDAVTKVKSLNHQKRLPDVTIVDYRLGVQTGPEAVRAMKTALDKELRIIAQSSFFEGDSRSDAIQHFKQEGVTSFLDRWDPGEVILHALRVVARGNTYVSPKIAIAGSTSGACKSLSDLEKRVAKLWARDLAAEEIADKLTTHVQRVTVDMVNVAKKKIKEKLKAAGVIGPGTLSYWLIQERDYGDPPWSKNA